MGTGYDRRSTFAPASWTGPPACRPAGLIVIGAATERPGLHGGIAAHVVTHAPSHVIVLNPRAGALGRAIPSVAGEADARGLWHAT